MISSIKLIKSRYLLAKKYIKKQNKRDKDMYEFMDYQGSKYTVEIVK